MAMEVDDATLRKLLDLQAEDTAIKRLNERKDSLPEAQRLAEVNAQLAELGSDIEIATKQFEEINREYLRLEGEIELLDQKISKEEQRMFSGNVANPKELSSLQAEVDSLKRKKGTLEDQLLEVMEQRENSETTRTNLESERSTAKVESEKLTETVGNLTKEIDAELREHADKRAENAPSIPEQLLKLYDQLRQQKHGVGAAALEAGTCLGCHTKLPAREVERMKAEGGLQRCDNCRRILVV